MTARTVLLSTPSMRFLCGVIVFQAIQAGQPITDAVAFELIKYVLDVIRGVVDLAHVIRGDPK